MMEIAIGSLASLLQQLFSKIKNKHLRKLLAVCLCFGGTFVYNYVKGEIDTDMIIKLTSAYGASQIVFGTLFDNKLVKNANINVF